MAFLAEKGKMIVHINLICKTHTSVRNTKMWTKTHRILECKILKFRVLLYRLCYQLVTRQTPVATYEPHVLPDSSCQGEPVTPPALQSKNIRAAAIACGSAS